MRLILPAALALAMVAPGVASATVIKTDPFGPSALLIRVDDDDDDDRRRRHRRDYREERRDYREDRRDERRAYRQGLRDGRQQARERGHYQPGYRADHRRYGRGQYLPAQYRTYVVHDYGRYGYPPPPRGCRYVRVGQDTYLTQIATGLILSAFSGGGY